MNPRLFLLKNECGISFIFKQGLVSESSVWTTELGCFLSSQKHQVILNLLVSAASLRTEMMSFQCACIVYILFRDFVLEQQA